MPVYAVAALLEEGWRNSEQGRANFQLNLEQAKGALRPHLDRGGVLSVEFQQDSRLGLMYAICKVAVDDEKEHPVRQAKL